MNDSEIKIKFLELVTYLKEIVDIQNKFNKNCLFIFDNITEDVEKNKENIEKLKGKIL